VLCFGEFQAPKDEAKKVKTKPKKPKPLKPPEPVAVKPTAIEPPVAANDEWACQWCTYQNNEATAKTCSMCEERKDVLPPLHTTEEASLLSQISAPGHVKEPVEKEDPVFDFGQPWTLQNEVDMLCQRESIASPRFAQVDSIERNWDEDNIAKARAVEQRLVQQDRLKKAARRANNRRRAPAEFSEYLDYAYTHAIAVAFNAADFCKRQANRAALEVERAQAIDLLFRRQAARESTAAVRKYYALQLAV
jgi:hypothetical protein